MAVFVSNHTHGREESTSEGPRHKRWEVVVKEPATDRAEEGTEGAHDVNVSPNFVPS